eukprot:TRINITY_DN7148_c0_g1_i2.p1 TRINITY_DN7148_c0_g1~~TRINITY_DN7148_c0_g1_i2.p1  ORF type:complete len:304 (+),score=64.08 TRINITY_DN7148_c0_g1_i2:3-914(+)
MADLDRIAAIAREKAAQLESKANSEPAEEPLLIARRRSFHNGAVSEPKSETTWRVHVVVAALVVIAAMLTARYFDLDLDSFFPSEMLESTRILSSGELAQYDGIKQSKVYLAVLGEVYDVTQGPDYYGPDTESEYRFFAAKDASRAFSSGEFHDTDSPPHVVDGLTDEQLHTVEFWRKFYQDADKYTRVGVVYQEDGTGFYDKYGQPTERMVKVQTALKRHAKRKAQEQAEEDKYPNCNSKWEQGVGGYFWCENGRVPRKGSITSDKIRCGCYLPQEAARHQDRLQVYAGCDAKASKCAMEKK